MTLPTKKTTEDVLDDTNTILKEAYTQLALNAFDGGEGEMTYTDDEMLGLLDRIKEAIENANESLQGNNNERETND